MNRKTAARALAKIGLYNIREFAMLCGTVAAPTSAAVVVRPKT